MDLVEEERGWLDRAARWLEATRVELVGLLVLLAGAAAATGALWLTALGGAQPATAPAEPGAPAAGIGVEVDPDDPDAAMEGGGSPRGGDGEPEDLTVHVTGAVASPGVVSVPAGARVADAIAAAGAPTDDAEPERLNLARPLQDGEQVHVPREGEELPPTVGTDGGGGAGGGPVDLNRAGAEQLEQLPGIGPARAAAIIEHREAHGPFAEPGDLRDVPGIGEATFQRVAEQVTVS